MSLFIAAGFRREEAGAGRTRKPIQPGIAQMWGNRAWRVSVTDPAGADHALAVADHLAHATRQVFQLKGAEGIALRLRVPLTRGPRRSRDARPRRAVPTTTRPRRSLNPPTNGLQDPENPGRTRRIVRHAATCAANSSACCITSATAASCLSGGYLYLASSRRMWRRSEARTCSFLSQSTVALRRTTATSSCAIALRVSSPNSRTAESFWQTAS